MINVVLYEPEIPQNTGNIIRSCMAMNARLHLIEPLGFYMDEAHLIDDLEIKTYENWDAFKEGREGYFYYITRYGKKNPSEFEYKDDKDIYLVFGKESTGIPKDILKDNLDTCIRIPMVKKARSLNLSNTVAIMLYEVNKQLDFEDLSKVEVIKGEDFLENF